MRGAKCGTKRRAKCRWDGATVLGWKSSLMTRPGRLLSLALLAGLATFGSVHALDQTPIAQVFRGRTDLVQLAAIVLDRQRRPIAGLQASDFTVLDNGKVRPISVFAPVSVPRAAPAAASASWIRDQISDVATNHLPTDGRIVVILFDRSIPVGQGTVRAREIAHSVVDALGPNDLAAVIRNSGFADGQVQGLTTDRSLLRTAIDSPFTGDPQPSPYILPGRPDCVCGLCVLERIEIVTKQLANLPGQLKNLIFIGRDITIQPPPTMTEFKIECAFPVRVARERAFRAVDRSNVIMHSIDVSGLETLAATADGAARASQTANLQRQGNLAVFPSYTGGRTVLNTNDFAEPIKSIFAETDTYYLLGIERDPTLKSDERRELKVRVNRPGATVRSRTGYYAIEADPPPDPAPAAVRAMRDLLPSRDLDMRLNLTPTFRTTGDVEVVAVVEVNGLAGPLQMVYGIFDPRAKPLGSGTFDAQSVEDANTDIPVLRAVSRLDLDDGQYEIRVGAEDPASGKNGSVYGYVTVPRLRDDEVMLSGVLVGVGRPPADDSSGGARTATLRRVFNNNETIVASFQVWDGRTPRGTTSLTLTVLDDNDRGVMRSTVRVEPSAFNAAGISEQRVTTPLGELSPGRYLLRLEADAKGESRRNIPFQVR